jgi:hypothetical protein
VIARRPRWVILTLAALGSFVVGAVAVAAVALLTGDEAKADEGVGVAVATAGLVNDVSGLLQDLESPLVAGDPAKRARIARQLAAQERRASRLIDAARTNVGDDDTRDQLVDANSEIRSVAGGIRRDAARSERQLIAHVQAGRRRLDRVRYKVDRLVADLGQDADARRRRRLARVHSSLFDRPAIDLPHANLVLRGGRPGQLAGASMSSAGDMNGDGRDDIVVAGPGIGEAYVVFGGSRNAERRLDALGPGTGFAITGLPSSLPASDDEVELLGAVDDLAVAGVGDLNDDGLDDIAIGAEEAYANDAEAAGAVYVVYGSRHGGPVDAATLGSRGFRIEGPGPFWRVGRSVSRVGDFDGDGREDLAIAGQEHFGTEDYTAAQGAPITWVLRGGQRRDGAVVHLSRSAAPSGAWRIKGIGSSLAAAGDVNGDGIDDLVGGDAYNRMNAPGYAAIVMGRRSGTRQIDATNGGSTIVPMRVREGRLIGTAVAGIGDQNGDGRDEVAVLSRDLGMEARVHVVFGRRNMGAVDLERLGERGAELELGEAPPDPEGSFGGSAWSVSGLASAGDVDGDRRQDLLVAAPPLAGQNDIRRNDGARLVSGRLIRPGRRVQTAGGGRGIVRIDTFGLHLFPSEYGLTQSSMRLAGLGDVDGDGLDDVALSSPTEAPTDEIEATNQGAVYVAFRRPAPGRGPLQGVLTHNGMGQVAVGMPAPRAETLLDATVLVQNGTCGYLFTDDSRLEVLVNNGSVGRVTISGPGIPTDAGIEVGDTIEKVEAAYDGMLERGRAEYDANGSTLTARFDDGRQIIYTTDGEKVVYIAGGREPEVGFVEGCS